MAKNSRLIDLTGKQFGLWSVIWQAGNSPRGAALWFCRCACGAHGTPSGGDLRAGKTKSCGCAIDYGRSLRTHGGSGTRLHRIWKAMKTRCGNPHSRSFKYYGALGISVCDEWASFDRFRAWALANGYKDALTIERVNNDLGYSPSNCIWATAQQQSVNRRFVLRNANGEAWSQIAKRNGIPVTLMHGRIHEGWPIEKAATLPRGSRLK